MIICYNVCYLFLEERKKKKILNRHRFSFVFKIKKKNRDELSIQHVDLFLHVEQKKQSRRSKNEIFNDLIII